MDRGWISVHRKIRECKYIWDDKPFSRGQAWIDLLLMVNHEDKEILFNGCYRKIERGQTLTSVVKLSDQWGWSRKKTTNFLNALKMAQMVDLKSDNKSTTITVINYGVYQDMGAAKEQQKSNKRTSEEHQRNTNNKYITMNNNINNKAFSDNEILNEAFNGFSEMRKTIKKPLTDRAIVLLKKKLNELSSDPEIQAKILDQSTVKCWQGVFPLKDDFVGKPKPKEKPEVIEEPEMTDEEFIAMVDSNFGEVG